MTPGKGLAQCLCRTVLSNYSLTHKAWLWSGKCRSSTSGLQDNEGPRGLEIQSTGSGAAETHSHPDYAIYLL